MKRGFTLIEMVVSLFLAVAAGSLVVTLFVLGRRYSETTYASYLVSRDTELGIGWLRRDLQNAALTSISPSKKGLSFVCCTTPAEPGQPQLNAYGAPRWSSEVYYTLAKDGNLVRWVRDYKQTLPLPLEHSPDQIGEEKHRRTVLTGLQEDGFRVAFVRRKGGEGGEESLSDENPAAVALKSGDCASTTRLIEIELRRLHVSNTGQSSLFAIQFRVCARY